MGKGDNRTGSATLFSIRVAKVTPFNDPDLDVPCYGHPCYDAAVARLVAQVGFEPTIFRL